MPQEIELFSGSVADNIRYGRINASDDEVECAARSANAHEFIARLSAGYNTLVGERGSALSVGEKQRIAIARAFLKDAPLLLMDEPTSSVDAASEAAICQAVLRLANGKTTFVIAHHFSTVMRADTIVVLDQGQIVEVGTHAELMHRRGLYSQLAELQLYDSRSYEVLPG